MLRKALCIVMLFCTQVRASENEAVDVNNEFQKLIYHVGMSLANQETICDQQAAQNAFTQIAQDVPAVEQIVACYVQIDSEMIAHNISSLEELIEYLSIEHADLLMAGSLWLAAFQNVFVVFNQIHQENVSFDLWVDDIMYLQTLENELLQDDSGYAHLQEACIVMLQAQQNFSEECKLLNQVQD